MSADIATKPDGTPVTADEQKSINLYQLTYDQIRQFDVGSKPHPQFAQQQKMRTYKPLLTELIDSVEAYARAKKLPLPKYNIEIKSAPATDGTYHPAPEAFVRLVLPICQQKLGTRFNIQSFDARPLQLIHQTGSIGRAGLPDGQSKIGAGKYTDPGFHARHLQSSLQDRNGRNG